MDWRKAAMASTGWLVSVSSADRISIGVGDAIEYDENDTGGIDQVVFIHERFSSTQFLVRQADGSLPNALVAAVILVSMSKSSVRSIVRLDPRYLNVGEKDTNLLVPSMSNESCGR